MKLFDKLRDAFAAIQFRDQVIAVIVVAVCILLGGNLVVLKPQHVVIARLHAQDEANQAQLASLVKQLAELNEAATSGGMFAAERAQLVDLKAQIAEVDKFFSQKDATTGQLGGLVRRLIQDNSDLTLVSLKTLPSAVFYSPPVVAPQAQSNTTLGEISSALKGKNSAPAPVALTDRTIYKHGVEVTLKGTYPALILYLQRMQEFPKRLFWFDANINVQTFPETTLKTTIYVLSDQPDISLD